MNESTRPDSRSFFQYPLIQLMLARVREFYREPQAVFWVYGFPVLIVVALGIAFRNKPAENAAVDVVAGPAADDVVKQLQASGKFTARAFDAETCRRQLRTGKSDLVIVPQTGGGYEFDYDPTRPESVLARNAADDVLQRAAGRKDPVPTHDQEMKEPGGRYIDFLVPGLVGMNLMGGGLWGVGFVTVDMRIRKLLKRFLATPMRKNHFLTAIMLSRLLFMLPEMLVIIGFAWLTFGVAVQGSLWAVLFLIVLGGFTFSGIGLLVASRARTVETVSGLMNLVMLPMWVLSGIFFRSDRFPDVIQPFIQVLPLTPLINALRAIFLEGASLASLWSQVLILVAWGLTTFLLALRWFRWE